MSDPYSNKEQNSKSTNSSDSGPQNGISDELYGRIPDGFKVSDLAGDENSAETENSPESPKSDGDERLSREDVPKSTPPKPPHASESPSPPPNPAGGSNRPKPVLPSTGTSNRRASFPPLFVFLLIALGIWLYYSTRLAPKTTPISWNGFCQQLDDANNIESVNLRGNIVSGSFRKEPAILAEKLSELLPNPEFQNSPAERWEIKPIPQSKNGPEMFGVGEGNLYTLEIFDKQTGKSTGITLYRRFQSEVPATAFADGTLDARIRKATDSFTSTTPPDNTGLFMLFSIGLSLLILVFFWRMMRRTNEQMMGGGFQGFTKSPMRRYDPNGLAVTFEDVAGLENVKKELVEIVDFLKNPEKYEKMGARVPKGTLLFGPPGTGKTLLGRAVAGEAGVPFFSINGSEFMQMFVGVGAGRVRELFTTAKENAPCILFIDEIDAVGRQRGTGLGGGHDEREQTLNQILSEMDGFVPTESVMVMAATNRPDVLDPALMRPGRFDRHITVDRPSLKGRHEIFDVYLKRIPKASDIDVDRLARSTVGFTGADIENLVNEAALWATRNNKAVVNAADFEFAHAKVIMGLIREESITESNKRKTACHEAGHTLLDWFSATNTKVHKVTIVPRGRALGATYILPEEDQLKYTQRELCAKLAGYLGGRVAEQIVYAESSTGAENDLKEATQLARRMVVHWGMSEKVGPVSFRAAESNPFLGREISEMREYSETTARVIDEEVVRILREAEDAATFLLNEKRDLLDRLTDLLVEEEELDQDRLKEILGPPVENVE